MSLSLQCKTYLIELRQLKSTAIGILVSSMLFLRELLRIPEGFCQYGCAFALSKKVEDDKLLFQSN